MSMYDGLVQNGEYMFEQMQGCSILNTEALVPYGFKRDGGCMQCFNTSRCISMPFK